MKLCFHSGQAIAKFKMILGHHINNSKDFNSYLTPL